ncbi:hypothetical protein K466DRAFT_397501 [Polyporus arcularius HHB13444]|uniref:Uncharacterized protein n=1 Tax=Polyporus arcularius HHB13444 TaxID=1314778 RepID=A0A5C3PXI0_9APHY|nr:hypothetical protein K466DRAFT_397501 [Polyporus arcularius HHB13444]
MPPATFVPLCTNMARRHEDGLSYPRVSGKPLACRTRGATRHGRSAARDPAITTLVRDRASPRRGPRKRARVVMGSRRIDCSPLQARPSEPRGPGICKALQNFRVAAVSRGRFPSSGRGRTQNSQRMGNKIRRKYSDDCRPAEQEPVETAEDTPQ